MNEVNINDFTNWREVIAFCEACGWQPNRMKKSMLAAELLVLAALDEKTLRKIISEPEQDQQTPTPKLQTPSIEERARRKLNFLKSRYERNMHLRDREPRDSFEWHVKDVAARVCVRQVDELEASLKKR